MCFCTVIALNETETMHWPPVFQIVFSGDYGKVYLSFEKERSVQAASRNNWFGLFLMQRFRDLIEIQDLAIQPHRNHSRKQNLLGC